MDKEFIPLDELRLVIKESVREVLAEFQISRITTYGNYMTVDQLCDESGYCKHSIYQMSYRKQIPGAVKLGGKLMFETRAVLAWIKDGCPTVRNEKALPRIAAREGNP